MPVYEVTTSQRVYQNVVARGAVRSLADHIPSGTGKVFVVTTEDVWHLHSGLVQEQFAPNRITVFFFPGGEPNKRLSAVEDLAEQLSRHGADRKSLVIGFGGGIVTDVAGFLAAIFMRGIAVIQVPTTLLAQVDAATGGKTGVNLVSGKNLIGSFHQPLAVLIDPELIETLPEREYRAGLFEIIKCGVIRDPALFDIFEKQPGAVLKQAPAIVDELISGAVRIKAEVVSADEREGDLRRILNFGHTVGHAIEAETGYQRFLHGEAIGCGMLAASAIARRIGLLARSEQERITAVINEFGPFPQTDDLSPERLLTAMGRDKKTVGGRLHFVLPTRIGDVQVVDDVPESVVRLSIAETLLQGHSA